MKVNYFKLVSRLLIFVLVLLILVVGASQAEEQAITRLITDMAGRTVEVPLEVNRIVCIHPDPTYMTWRLAPNKLLNIDSESEKRIFKSHAWLFSDSEKKRFEDLPVTGIFTEINKEQLLALEPDIIISVADDPNIDKLQDVLGIPVVTVSRRSVNDYEANFRFAGKLLGNEKCANELADYWHSVIERITDKTSKIPKNEKIKVYYVGLGGALTTMGSGSCRTDIIRLAGGNPFSDYISGPPTESLHVEVSMEEILIWNPDVIVTQSAGPRDEILSSSKWQEINAVKNNRVYIQPKYETLYSISQIMGLVWLVNILYPESIHLDLMEEAKTFWSKFFYTII